MTQQTKKKERKSQEKGQETKIAGTSNASTLIAAARCNNSDSSTMERLETLSEPCT